MRDWTRLRSVSEALKGEVYTFADASDLAGHVASVTPVSRTLPPVTDVPSYAAIRVTGQLRDYYQPRAALISQRLTLIRRAEFGLAAVAALLGAAAAAFGVDRLSAWVATVTTVAAAMTAHAAAARYAYQQLEFSRTATELDRLLAHHAVADEQTSQTDDAFVQRCEHVISAQNEAWMAKWAAE